MQKMTQNKLAKKTYITEVTISRYMDGKRTPSAKAITAIAKILDTTPGHLLEDNKNPKTGYIKTKLKHQTDTQKINLIRLLTENM